MIQFHLKSAYPPPIMRSIHLDTCLLKKGIIAQVTNNSPNEIVFTDKQTDRLYDLAVKYTKNDINKEELIMELRGGGFEDWVEAFGVIMAIVMILNNVDAFQVPPNQGEIVPPHLQLLYGNQQPGNHFGYGKGAGPRSITVTGAKNSEFASESDRHWIQSAYAQIPNLSVEGTNRQITAWSAAKHAHHGPDFGLDPTKYGVTQADLDSIAENGLINHINKGGTPPNAKFVQDFQKCWKKVAEHKDTTQYLNQTVMGRNSIVLKHSKTGLFVAFDSTTGESFTSYCLTEKQSIRHDLTGTIGKIYPKK